MPLAQPIETLRKDLQELLVDDLAAALKQLQQQLPENSEKQLQVVALLGRFNAANKERLRGTVSNDELQRLYNQIRADLLDLVAGLVTADFDAATAAHAAADGKPAPRQGSVLYRVPHIMPLDQETKCVVRIALQEDAIVENITLDEHVQLKSLYRVSDTMQAELLDPSGGQVFRIRGTSEPVQLIDEEGYTEWRFYVTPLQEGAFPLEVKVSVIELVYNQPRKKEIVLEETVRVVTGSRGPADVEAAEAPLKPAGYALAFGTTTTADLEIQEEMQEVDIFSGDFEWAGAPGKSASGAVPPPPPILPAKENPVFSLPQELSQPRKSSHGWRKAVLFFLFLIVGSVTTLTVLMPMLEQNSPIEHGDRPVTSPEKTDTLSKPGLPPQDTAAVPLKPAH